FDIIRRHSWGAKGIHPHEIARLAHITRQGVYPYLRELIAEDKILKTKGKGLYVLKDIVEAIVYDGWSLSEFYLNTTRVVQDNRFLKMPGFQNIPINCYRNGFDE